MKHSTIFVALLALAFGSVQMQASKLVKNTKQPAKAAVKKVSDKDAAKKDVVDKDKKAASDKASAKKVVAPSKAKKVTGEKETKKTKKNLKDILKSIDKK